MICGIGLERKLVLRLINGIPSIYPWLEGYKHARKFSPHIQYTPLILGSLMLIVELSFCMMLNGKDPLESLSWKVDQGPNSRLWVGLSTNWVHLIEDSCPYSRGGLWWF